jgi:hypothetical protein
MFAAHDLAALDRDVARAHAALERWRGAITADPAAHADEEPLAAVRSVAGQTTYDVLRALEPAASELPLRDALVRWVVALTQARIGREVEVAWARAANEEGARLRLEPPRLVSWREAWRGVVASESVAEAEAWLGAAAERAPSLAPIARERAERRVEVARRLGLDHPAALATRVPRSVLASAAASFLDASDDLSAALLREARTERAARPPPAYAILLGIAKDAREGWPARLAARWLEELFGGLVRGARLELPALPEPVGATSFARALGAFGWALRQAGRAPGVPFAVARDPEPAPAHRFRLVFSALAASPEFHQRALGTGSRVAAAQARSLSRAALFATRLAAARFLLTDDACPATPALFDELTTRLFAAPLPAAFAGVWPRAHDDDTARALALFTVLPLARELIERFDIDWFRNPRAFDHLRALASAPAYDDRAELDADAPRALAKAFEEALA